MTEQNDGGPAFPHFVPEGHYNGSIHYGGMTLRDWFAGQAPTLPTISQAHVGAEPSRDIFPVPDGTPYAEMQAMQADADLAWLRWRARIHAEWSHIYADAMLKAREARHD